MLAAGLALLCSCLLATPTFAANRSALVIGNADYARPCRLSNPCRDARLMLAQFRKLHMTPVKIVLVTDPAAVCKALAAFTSRPRADRGGGDAVPVRAARPSCGPDRRSAAGGTGGAGPGEAARREGQGRCALQH